MISRMLLFEQEQVHFGSFYTFTKYSATLRPSIALKLFDQCVQTQMNIN